MRAAILIALGLGAGACGIDPEGDFTAAKTCPDTLLPVEMEDPAGDCLGAAKRLELARSVLLGTSGLELDSFVFDGVTVKVRATGHLNSGDVGAFNPEIGAAYVDSNMMSLAHELLHALNLQRGSTEGTERDHARWNKDGPVYAADVAYQWNASCCYPLAIQERSE